MIGDIGIRGLSDLRWIRPGTVLQLEQFLYPGDSYIYSTIETIVINKCITITICD